MFDWDSGRLSFGNICSWMKFENSLQINIDINNIWSFLTFRLFWILYILILVLSIINIKILTPEKLLTGASHKIYLIKHASWNSWIVCLSFSKWLPGIWTGGSSVVNIKPRPRDFGKTEVFIWIAGNIEMMISQNSCGIGKWTMTNETPKSRFLQTRREWLMTNIVCHYLTFYT